MDAKTELNETAERKTRIFISYSRKDMEFVDRLEVALKVGGFDPLIDRTEIYAFEDWWKRLQNLIGQADTVVFVLSPESVASREALKEVEYATSLNKRFAPIVCRRVDDVSVPDALRRLNFIFFDDPAHFQLGADQLVEALKTDIGWIRQHTSNGEAAHHWSATSRPGGLLLRSPALEEAERWVATRPPGAPLPTKETLDFISESRRAATRRRNVLTGSLAAGLLVALALAGVAYWQREIALLQRNEALISESYFLTDRARAEDVADNTTAATLLALAALPDQGAGIDRPLVPAAKFALLASSQRLGDAVLRGHQAPVVSASFSPDGLRIVSASYDKTARLWDATLDRQITALAGHDAAVNSAVFSPDGERIVTASADGTARLWDGKNGNLLAKLVGHRDAVTNAAFSAKGDRIVTASVDGTARLWDGVTGAPLGTLAGHSAAVASAAFSPDGTRVVTASADMTAKLWDTRNLTLLGTLSGHGDKVNSAAFSPDGARVATASADKDVRVWDGTTGALLATMSGHDEAVLTVVFSPDGKRIVSASTDSAAELWDVEQAKSINELQSNGTVLSATFSPDGGRIVTASGDGTVRIWSGITGAPIAVLSGHTALVQTAAFAADSKRIVSASYDTTVRLWDGVPGLDAITLSGVGSDATTAVFSADGSRVFTASRNGELRVWDAGNGAPMSLIVAERSPVVIATAAIGADGDSFATSTWTTNPATVWSWAAGSPPVTIAAHTGLIVSLQFSPSSNHLLTSSWDKTAAVWDAKTGAALAKLVGHDKQVTDARFSGDGGRIVTASLDATAKIWDAASGRLLATLSGPSTSGLSHASFSPDGTVIVTAAQDYMVRIWDVASGTIRAELPGHTAAVTSTEFSPDGSVILTGSEDGTLRFWDTKTGSSLAVLVARIGKLVSAKFSTDGSRIVVAYSSGIVRILNLFPNTQNLVDEAKHRVSRCLDSRERAAAHLAAGLPVWCTVMKKYTFEERREPAPNAVLK
jgi:WD40 repeat protein